MSKLDGHGARYIADCYGFRINVEFHVLTSSEVDGVLAAADSRGYRKPRTANGSRARYFHQYLRRLAG